MGGGAGRSRGALGFLPEAERTWRGGETLIYSNLTRHRQARAQGGDVQGEGSRGWDSGERQLGPFYFPGQTGLGDCLGL